MSNIRIVKRIRSEAPIKEVQTMVGNDEISPKGRCLAKYGVIFLAQLEEDGATFNDLCELEGEILRDESLGITTEMLQEVQDTLLRKRQKQLQHP